jgi:hypothetical protein
MALGNRPMRHFELKAKKKPLSLADLNPERRARPQNNDNEPGETAEAGNDSDDSRLYSEWPRAYENQQTKYIDVAIKLLRDRWLLVVVVVLILGWPFFQNKREYLAFF